MNPQNRQKRLSNVVKKMKVNNSMCRKIEDDLWQDIMKIREMMKSISERMEQFRKSFDEYEQLDFIEEEAKEARS